MGHRRAKTRHGGGKVKHGSRAKIHFKVAADDALQSRRIRQLRYGHGAQQAAILAGVDADQIAAVRPNGLEGISRGEDGFIQHDGDVSSGPQARTALEISTAQGLLEGIDVELLQGGEGPGGLALCPAAIGVHGDGQ
jgi:hypothetical protein